MADERSLDALLDEVRQEGQKFTDFLTSNSYYQPSFKHGGFTKYEELTEDVQQSRKKLAEAAKALYQLATEPSDYVRSLGSSVSNVLARCDRRPLTQDSISIRRLCNGYFASKYQRLYQKADQLHTHNLPTTVTLTKTIYAALWATPSLTRYSTNLRQTK
jgi:hypothetical protein